MEKQKRKKGSKYWDLASIIERAELPQKTQAEVKSQIQSAVVIKDLAEIVWGYYNDHFEVMQFEDDLLKARTLLTTTDQVVRMSSDSETFHLQNAMFEFYKAFESCRHPFFIKWTHSVRN